MMHTSCGANASAYPEGHHRLSHTRNICGPHTSSAAQTQAWDSAMHDVLGWDCTVVIDGWGMLVKTWYRVLIMTGDDVPTLMENKHKNHFSSMPSDAEFCTK